ncbi:MAG: hypothetical protein P4M11_07205 [Candidatus Pacebacteria bacterium]|nr:hypothetical protein [Candidatus Paceibacterota bacterium]
MRRVVDAEELDRAFKGVIEERFSRNAGDKAERHEEEEGKKKRVSFRVPGSMAPTRTVASAAGTSGSQRRQCRSFMKSVPADFADVDADLADEMLQ